MPPVAIPYIAVKDVAATVDFYVKKLGFTLNTPTYYPDNYAHVYLGASPAKSAAQIMFHPYPGVGNVALGFTKYDKYCPCDVLIQLNGEPGKGKEIVDEYYDALVAKGAQVKEKPEDKPWNCRQATFEDPDGNRIGFYFWLGEYV